MAQVSDKDKALAREVLARWKDEWSLEAMVDQKHAGWRKLVDESLESHIATALASRSAEWQPIETADSEKLALLYTPAWRLWDDPTDKPIDIRVAKPRDWTWATHWLPIPDPPETKP